VDANHPRLRRVLRLRPLARQREVALRGHQAPGPPRNADRVQAKSLSPHLRSRTKRTNHVHWDKTANCHPAEGK
jgi:hypothetical protein